MRPIDASFAFFTLFALVPSGCNDATPITFTGQASPLPAFSYDTGLLPSGSPAQLELSLTATGGVSVSAQAAVHGTTLEPSAGTGTVSLDLHFHAAGRLKISSTLKKYDGPIPGLDAVDIAASATTAFDPFLVGGGSADVTAPILATKLPDIPLGSIPGSLQLAIGEGSTMTSSFTGTCMMVQGGTASYQGAVTTSGTLVLKATLALDLPTPLNKSVALPDITVKVPPTMTAIDLGSQPVAGVDDASQGTCPALGGKTDGGGTTNNDGGGGTTNDGGGGTTDDGGGACVANGGSCSFASSSNCCSGACETAKHVCIEHGSVLIAKPAGAQATFIDETAPTSGAPGFVYVYFTAPGLGPSTRIVFTLPAVGSGCVKGTNGPAVQFQPDDGTFHTYFDDGSPSCGLVVTSLPPAHIVASFGGTVQDVHGDNAPLVVSFDLPSW